MSKGTSPLSVAARAFHALSDPTRLAIIDRLRRGERCVCELTGAIGASQPRLSFHLKTLKDAGLVVDRREGRWIYYRLAEERLRSLGQVLHSCCDPISDIKNC